MHVGRNLPVSRRDSFLKISCIFDFSQSFKRAYLHKTFYVWKVWHNREPRDLFRFWCMITSNHKTHPGSPSLQLNIRFIFARWSSSWNPLLSIAKFVLHLVLIYASPLAGPWNGSEVSRGGIHARKNAIADSTMRVHLLFPLKNTSSGTIDALKVKQIIGGFLLRRWASR